jgi:hypothetical protein
VVDLSEVENFVFDAVDIVETPLRDPSLDRHLAPFMRHLPLVTGTALATLVTLGGRTALTGCFTAA